MREFGVGSRGRVSPSSHRSMRPPRAQADRLGRARRRRADEPTWSRAADFIQRILQVRRCACMPSQARAYRPRNSRGKRPRSARLHPTLSHDVVDRRRRATSHLSCAQAPRMRTRRIIREKRARAARWSEEKDTKEEVQDRCGGWG